MPTDLTKKIDSLSQKLAQLKAQKQQADALARARSSAANRKLDTRRKILLGAYLLDQLGIDGVSQLKVQGRRFDEWLSKTDDLNLFNLPLPLTTPATIGGEG